ncbi:MAG TPA: Dabb family protein [Polyangiaceae bacterium]|nr:Dabb family protein [Polyangiaceae bacterium]
MVTHVVLFKMKDRTGASARAVRDALLGMRGKIPGLESVEVGVDYLRSERSFDVALITRHVSREALDAYQTHPVHEKVKEFIFGVRDASICVDFED